MQKKLKTIQCLVSIGPQYWGKYYSTCGSVARQSPVNLDPSVAVLDDQLDEISLVNTPSMKKNSISMINNGHTGESDKVIYIQ